MDSLIRTAARALADGDPLGALKRVALRDDAPALALRGIAMAQLGDLVRAKALLRSAARAFGAKETVARARCVVAETEIALVTRDLGWPAETLDAARATLEARGDRINAAYARYLEARRLLLIGRLDEAERTLAELDPAPFPSALRTAHELVVAGIASAACGRRRIRRPEHARGAPDHGRRGAGVVGSPHPCRDSRRPCCSPRLCPLTEADCLRWTMRRATAEILLEYGPFSGVDQVHGVTYDGRRDWLAAGETLNAFDPASGKRLRTIEIAAQAGTAFDGEHLFQLAEGRIQKIDPRTGRVLSTIPAPGGGGDSGLAWDKGSLWVGQHRERKIHQVDPETGAILRTIETNRFVTGVTWVDGELWHGTWEGDESALRRVDPRTGEVLEELEMPPGVGVSGLESDGGDRFFCGGGPSGKVRSVRRPGRGSATASRSATSVDSTSKQSTRS